MRRWLSLNVIERFVPMMKRQKVSEVARSPRGFLTAYREAGGHHQVLDPEWKARREAFVARHVAQARAGGESLYDHHGYPTRRHLALIAWAYTPHPARIAGLARRLRERG